VSEFAINPRPIWISIEFKEISALASSKAAALITRDSQRGYELINCQKGVLRAVAHQHF
jgi:hypothetical protein